MNQGTRSILGVAMLAIAACQGDLGHADHEAVESGTAALVDDTLQGRALVGFAGTPLRVDYDPVVLDGQPVTDVAIVEGRLLGRGVDHHEIEGADWRGALFQGRTPGGALVALRVDAVDQPDREIDAFTLSRLVDGAWTPYCAEDLEGRIEAVPVAAVWDLGNGDRLESTTQFTFACRKGVIAKCIGWNYRPWRVHAGRETMIDVHQACTRAGRADYCGNGHPNTLDGTTIRIYDGMSPPIRDHTAAHHSFEAAWSKYGARCLTHLRWQELTPECEVPSDLDVDLERGPFSLDGAGQRTVQEACDTPPEASERFPHVIVFTESLSNEIDP